MLGLVEVIVGGGVEEVVVQCFEKNELEIYKVLIGIEALALSNTAVGGVLAGDLNILVKLNKNKFYLDG